MTDNPQTDARRERYAVAIHDAMEPDLSLVDQEPGAQALFARAAEAAAALADTEQNRRFLTLLADLGIATHRLDRIRDAARLHRQQLIGSSELYAVIEADAPAVPVSPTTTTADHPSRRAGLRQQLAAAMREHYLCTNREEADADGNMPCRCGDWREPGAEEDDENDWGTHLADVLLAVLYREWPWLRAEAEDAVPADQSALRDRIAEALAREDAHNAGYDHGFASSYGADDETNGFVNAVLAVLPPPADRAAVLLEVAGFLRGLRATRTRVSVRDIENDLREQAAAARRLADEAQQQETDGAARVRALHRKASHGETCVYCAHGQRLGYDTTWPCDTIRALDGAEAQQQPDTETQTPCDQPNACDPDTGELCATHEEEKAHADGEHEYCGITCEVQMPTAPMRNSIVAHGIPGTAGMLDELLRRAAAGLLPTVEEPGPDIVAYRNPDQPEALWCLKHGGRWWGLTPLVSDDLPDGGVCGDCGGDVLIPQQPAVEAQQQPAATDPGDQPGHTGGNAEDCPACIANGIHKISYPWTCPGEETEAPGEVVSQPGKEA